MTLSDKYKPSMVEEQQIQSHGRENLLRYVAVALPVRNWRDLVMNIEPLDARLLAHPNGRAHFIEAAKEAERDPPMTKNITEVIGDAGISQVRLRHASDTWRRGETLFQRNTGVVNSILDPPTLPPEFWAHWDRCMEILQGYAEADR